MISSPSTLHSFDTDYPADSVEFCPSTGYQQYFVCGTYFLETNKEDTASVDADTAAPVQKGAQTRIGRCWLFESDDLAKPCNPSTYQPYLISNGKSYSTNPRLAIADAIGCLRFYDLADASSSSSDAPSNLKEVQVLQCTSTSNICLSLDWSNRLHPNSTTDKVVTSISDGSICIAEDVDGMFKVTNQWHAHDYEPWIAAWDYWNTSIIYTGGDDLSWKAWDSRTDLMSPVFHNKRLFEGGVTSIQANPHIEHQVAVGSYDGHVRIFDTRKPVSPLSSVDVGGGAWRVKWHPAAQRKGDILVACMHGGFKIVRWDDAGDDAKNKSSKVLADYRGHESLAYGVDWSVTAAGSTSSQDTLVASCSFYDHTLKTWRA